MSIEPVTLQCIANRAGVSVSTVHRVIKNKKDVSRRTANMVMQIACELGYQGPANAHENTSKDIQRQTSNNHFRTYNIALLLIERPLELLRQPLNARLLAGLESALAGHNLMLTVILVPDPDILPPTISTERIDGAVFMGDPSSPKIQSRLKRLRSVGVFASEHMYEHWSDWVTSDYQARGRLAANYLINRGHEKIAHLNVKPYHSGFKEVGMAFAAAGKNRGAKVSLFSCKDCCISDIAKPAFYCKSIHKIIKEIANISIDQRPTGLHVPNDETAIDVYKSLRDCGIEPMKDMDIISCDNDEFFLNRLSPRPATMDLNIKVIAEKLVEKLLERIKNPNAFAGIRVMVPPYIIPPDN